MRKVTVIASQRNGYLDYNTAATTWGQLKDLLSRDLSNIGEMVATVKETRNTLGVNESVLPTGDFTLFLTQAKIKAGAVDMKKVLEDLRDEFADAIQNTLDKLDEGDFDVDARQENATVTSGRNSRTASGISDEDRRIMEQLQTTLRG